MLAGCILLLAGCAVVGAPMPPSLNVPKPVDDLRAVRKGNAVTLSWSVPTETTDGALIHQPGKMVLRRGLRSGTTGPIADPSFLPVQRPLPAASKSTKPQTVTVTDNLAALLRPATADFAVYTVESESESGKNAGASNQASVSLAPIAATPKSIEAKVVPQGVNISWEEQWQPPNESSPPDRIQAQFAYRILRQEQGSNAQPVTVQQVGLSNEAIRVIDRSIQWEKNYNYWVTPVTTWQDVDGSRGEVEGDDSPGKAVWTHDIFPPAPPGGLQAVFSGISQSQFIDLTWTPNNEEDLAGYNLYRRSANDQQAIRINPELIKSPAFRDREVRSGMKYF